MEIAEVRDKRDEQRFLEVSRVLYQNDLEWICPPDKEICSVFDPSKNLSFQEGNAKRWYLMQNGKLAGRIAAFYNTGHWKPDKPKTGGIGFFECINDRKAASLLFDTACEWLRQMNVEAADGPVNFGERDKYWGLLVEGFDAPSYQDNYNPPYYRELFEAYGFEKLIEQTTNRINYSLFKKERIENIVRRVERNAAIIFRHFQRKDLRNFAKDFVVIYNSAWLNHEDFIPVTEELITQRMKSMLPVILDEAIWFAYVNDEPAAFFVTVPDINPLLRPFKGRFNFWKKLLLMYGIRTKKIHRLRGIVFGIVPKHQNKGLDAGMILHLHDALQNHPEIKEAELSWVGDFNPRMMALHRNIGAYKAKSHITYRKSLTEVNSR